MTPGRLRGAIVVLVLATSIAAIAPAAWGSNSHTIEVRPGPLGHSGSDVAFSARSLNGSDQSVAASPASPWQSSNARGTDAGWAVSMAASGDLVSAAGSEETTARTIPISQLSLAPGAPAAMPGSDGAANLSTTSLVLSSSGQTYLSCSSGCKGRYEYTPAFTLIIPAGAYRSNYSGAVGSSSLNPYVVTLSLTIA